MPYRVPGAYARFVHTPSAVNNVGATRTMGIIGTGANYFEVYNETIQRSTTQPYDQLSYPNVFEVISITDRPLVNGAAVRGTKLYEEGTAFTLRPMENDAKSLISWSTITAADVKVTANSPASMQLKGQITAIVDGTSEHLVADGSYTFEICYIEDAFDHADIAHVNCGCYRVTNTKTKKILGEWGVSEEWRTDVIPGLKIKCEDVFVPDADGNSITALGDYVTITTTAAKTEMEPQIDIDTTVASYNPRFQDCLKILKADATVIDGTTAFLITDSDDVESDEWDIEIVDATTQEIQITRVSDGTIVYGPRYVGAVDEYLNVIPGITFMLPELNSDCYTGDVLRIVTTAATYGDAIPENEVYYISYKYKKKVDDYKPKIFYDYDDVVNEYGNYDVTASMVVINSLSLGAELAMRAGVNPIVCVQAKNDSDYEMKKAIDLLVADVPGIDNVNTIVPLTSSASVGSYAQDHVNKMSAEAGRHERMVYLGATPGQPINKAATAADKSLGMKQRAEAYSDERVVYVVPGRVTYDVKSLQTGRVTERTLPGCYLALGVATVGLTHDPAEPLTRKKIGCGFNGLLDMFSETEKNALAESGCCVVEERDSGLRVRHGITTCDDEVNTTEITLIQIKDYVIAQVRKTLDNLYVGIKNLPSAKQNIKFSVSSILTQFVSQEIILGYQGLTVKDSPDDPREVLVNFQLEAVYPLNYITISFNFASTGA